MVTDAKERQAPPGYRDLLGVHFGKLVVTSFSGRRNGQTMWKARCECGSTYEYQSGNLLQGFSRGCRDCCTANLKHGLSRSPEYTCWHQMLQRCNSPKSKAYKYYGARGISVCKRWRDSFEAFYSDMGPRTSDKHSIDRINNDGNYEPGNCRWATAAEQARNQRREIKMLTCNGETLAVAEWADRLGVSRQRIHQRLAKMPAEVALSYAKGEPSPVKRTKKERPPRPPKPERIKTGPWYVPMLTHAERRERRRLIANRINEGLSVDAAATEFDVTTATIRAALKEFQPHPPATV